MRSTSRLARLTTALALAAALVPPALAKERGELPLAEKWNLDELYPSEQAWEQARAAAAARVPELGKHQGQLGDSAEALLTALTLRDGLSLELARLGFYASARSDEDTRQARPRELKQGAQKLRIDFSAAAAWIEPELLALDPARLAGFLAAEPRLAPWRFYLEDVARARAHTRTASEEALLAQAGELAGAGAAVYGILKDADLPWPTVKLSSGKVRLDPAAYTLARGSRVKADRELAFKEFFGAFKRYERTFGTTLDAQLKADLFEAKAHRFPDALSAALFRSAIPTEVYTQLVSDVRRNLPALHRYLKLRQRMLGLKQLRYQDIYAPMVAGVKLEFTPDEARQLTLAAVAPLGPDYVAALGQGFKDRWTDLLPSTGKRPGAYSEGIYGVHPYQLLNYYGQYDDVSTLAHESGHSMHSYLANRTQPFQTADYPIFVAEVASTLNENLLLHHMLGQAKDDQTRLALLGNYLDGLRQTLFRQASFAEFELEAHRRVERGEPVTGEALSALYLKLVRDYYGHDAGVCQVDDLIGVEWAYIPHFYLDYYVFQYSTSLVASTSIAKAIREEAAAGSATRARDGYLAMLSAGGSRYPVQLLKEAGVDMTTSGPFDAAIAEMNGVMDEMEKILARKDAARKKK